MSRLPRRYQIQTSCVFHLLNRGILRQNIFHDDADALYFLEIIKRYKQKFLFSIYHWCLMPNHYHLVGEFPQPYFISKIIGACQQIYALYYHRRYATAGRLFQNRFKSQAIEKESYLLACGRYVELNPVRAKLVMSAWDWKWSSVHFYLNNKNYDITSPDPCWEDGDAQSYTRWISDMQSAEKEGEIFSSSKNIIGSQNFQRGLVMVSGHPQFKQYGRPRKDKNSIITS